MLYLVLSLSPLMRLLLSVGLLFLATPALAGLECAYTGNWSSSNATNMAVSVADGKPTFTGPGWGAPSLVGAAWEATAVWNPAGHYAVSLSRVRHGNVSFCLLVMQIGGSVDMTPPVAVADAAAGDTQNVSACWTEWPKTAEDMAAAKTGFRRRLWRRLSGAAAAAPSVPAFFSGAPSGGQVYCFPLWVGGFLICCVGSFLSTLGLNLQKLTQTRIFERRCKEAEEAGLPLPNPDDDAGEAYCKHPLWMLGMICLILDAILDVLSFGLASQSLIAPLAGLCLIWNILIAPPLQGEPWNYKVRGGEGEEEGRGARRGGERRSRGVEKRERRERQRDRDVGS